MSRISKSAKEMTKVQELRPDEIITNFMGGFSYRLTPLETLKIISASSIFGEAAYYRTNGVKDDTFHSSEFIDDCFFKDSVGKTTTEIFEEAIDAALAFDFGGVLEWAVELRETYNMRLNPQVIMVRAAMHPDREKWTSENHGQFNIYEQRVMARADEPATQLAYFIYLNSGKKSKMPSILKRSIADKLSALTRHQVNKYKNAEIGMINAVRLTHASSPIIDELMRTGTVMVSSSNKTWEQLRSDGMGWRAILETTKIGHMALLRNLRGIFSEIHDGAQVAKITKKLIDGVPEGKQFPFRYESAHKAIEESDLPATCKSIILDGLEECMDIAIDNLPKLKGSTVCLSDNSGSAWGAVTTEYGSAKIAEIDNLSSVIAAKCSDSGCVVKFGDNYKTFPISKRNGCLIQSKAISSGGSVDVGGGTEGGIWKFFKEAIDTKTHYDNIFIFSDQQAGTGGLYGTYQDIAEYKHRFKAHEASYGRIYLNVYALIKEYRRKVNPKVNVFSVQTAGYENVLIPQMSYRCAILTGWTGKEVSFAAEYIRQWDEIESSRKIQKQ